MNEDISITDLEIIYRVVVRNLNPDQSAEIMLEAQEAMLREAQALIVHSDISALQKRRLFNFLELLKMNAIILYETNWQ